MYKLITAVLMTKEKPTGLVEVDVANYTLTDVLNNYKLGYLVLENDHLVDELFLDINKLRTTPLGLATYDITITNWLIQNGNALLPHTTVEPDYAINKINYTDAHQGGFERKAVHPYSTISGYPVSSLTDLYLQKASIDSKLLSESVVAVVNGYLHIHDKFKEGIKIKDGCKSIMYAKSNHVGILSFQELGGCKLVKLDPRTTYRGKDNLPYYHEMLVNLGMDLTNKSVLLSIAGNFIYTNDIYKVIDAKNGIAIINLSRLNLAEKIQQTVKYVSMPESLQYIEQDRLATIDRDIVKSDAFILDLLRMSQTFAIVVDYPHIVNERKPVFYNGTYGIYYSEKHKYRPMIDAYGRIVPYFYYGNQKLPRFPDKHVYQIPLEYVEKSQNVQGRHPNSTDRYIYKETITEHTEPMRCDWLNLSFIKPL